MTCENTLSSNKRRTILGSRLRLKTRHFSRGGGCPGSHSKPSDSGKAAQGLQWVQPQLGRAVNAKEPRGHGSRDTAQELHQAGQWLPENGGWGMLGSERKEREMELSLVSLIGPHLHVCVYVCVYTYTPYIYYTISLLMFKVMQMMSVAWVSRYEETRLRFEGVTTLCLLSLILDTHIHVNLPVL